jgi:hypothetical protein
MIAATRAWRMRVQRQVVQAVRNMGDPIRELQVKIPGVQGPIDVVSQGRAIEVKTSPNNGDLDKWQAQVTRLVNYAKANDLKAEYWHQNPIHPDRLKFLTDNGVKAITIP